MLDLVASGFGYCRFGVLVVAFEAWRIRKEGCRVSTQNLRVDRWDGLALKMGLLYNQLW